MSKADISFSADGERVSYSERRVYHFLPDSPDPRDTMVTVPNIPLLGAMRATRHMGAYAARGFRSVIE